MNPLNLFGNKLNHMQAKLLLSVVIFFVSVNVMAQQGKDTTKKQSINIVSSYKPVLRNAVKINFSGAQLNADTSKTVKAYNIPSQNLFYAYQAIPLKALALQQDTSLYLGDRNYIKAGFGNLTTPYVNVGLGIGDGKTYLANVYGTYISSNGKIKNQDYSLLNIKAAGSYFLKKNELYASFGTKRDEYYLYGYDHLTMFPKRKDIRQQFQQIDVAAGVRNTVSTEYQISYNPNFQGNFFTNVGRLSETNLIIDAPVEKKFGKSFVLKLDAKADLTKYSSRGVDPNYSYNNNVEQLAPSLVYNSPRLIINGGIIPTWNNGVFEYLPNVFAEAQLAEKVFMIQAGWVGRIIKNTYHNLSAINPYIAPLASQTNTKEMEFYSGIKATVGKHFNFNAKVGFVRFKNFALFVNDISAGGANMNSFKVNYEPTMQSLRIHGDISYILQDKFTATAAVTMNGYTGMDVNAKAWNTVPMEFTGSVRWWVFEKLLVKGDVYLFGGGKWQGIDGNAYPFSGGSDLGAGLEYKINRQFSAFFDVNNILNDKYQRWHNYEVYGVNFMGGVIFRF